MKLNRLEEYEIIDGKPFGGHWYGSSHIFSRFLTEPLPSNPIYIETRKKLRDLFPKDFELRNESIIYRPPYCSSVLNQSCTLGIKFLVWGRAFKLMKLKRVGKKSYKKCFVCGRRKRIRIR